MVDALPPMYREEPSASVSLKVVLGGGACVVLVELTAGRRAPLGLREVAGASVLPFRRFRVLALSRLRDLEGFWGPLGLATSLMPSLEAKIIFR